MAEHSEDSGLARVRGYANGGNDPVDNWFDGSTPCPACDHVCFDHAACREAPNCVCHHPCHFGPER